MRALLILMFTTGLAFGKCNEIYKDKSKEIKSKYIEHAQASGAMSSVAASSFSLATLVTPILPNSAFITTTITGQVYLYGALINLALSAEDFVTKSDLDWVARILEQSEVEFGKDIQELADETSIALNKKVTARELSWVIDEANKFDHFCPKEGIIMSKEQFVDYIEKVVAPMVDFNAPIGWRELRVHYKRSLGL